MRGQDAWRRLWCPSAKFIVGYALVHNKRYNLKIKETKTRCCGSSARCWNTAHLHSVGSWSSTAYERITCAGLSSWKILPVSWVFVLPISGLFDPPNLRAINLQIDTIEKVCGKWLWSRTLEEKNAYMVFWKTCSGQSFLYFGRLTKIDIQLHTEAKVEEISRYSFLK